MNVPRLSVQNPVAANLVMVGLIVGGLYFGSVLVREFFPNTAPEKIFVTVPYPGGTPEEIEKTIARRVERELEGIDDVEEIESTVYEGLSVTDVTLEEGADRTEVLNDVRGEVDKVKPDLPDGAEDPEIRLIRPFIPVISVVVFGDVGEDRLHEAALAVRDDVQNLEGISEVVVSGLRQREIQAEVLPGLLEEHRLTFGEVGRAVAAGNLDLPGGRLETPRGNVQVRTVGESDRALGLEGVIVRSGQDGTVVRLRDLGRVRETFEDKIERGRYAAKDAVQITVFKAPEEDALEIAERVKGYVGENSERFGASIRLDTITDLSRFISQRIDLMTRNGSQGLVLIVIVLAFFLSVRVAFWVALGLPISLLGTFIVMHVLGATINLISLFGLIVVLGLIVDDAIIIAERIFTRIRRGDPPPEAAEKGARDVAKPVLAAVLTTIAAFLPLAFIEGRIGVFLGVLPVVVIAALAVSLIEAFAILPCHLRHGGGGGRWKLDVPLVTPAARRFIAFKQSILERWVPDALERTLSVCIRWRYVTLAVGVAGVMVAAGLMAGGVVEFEFLQATDAESVSVDVEMAAGTPEERTVEVVERIERFVLDLPETSKAFSVVGTSFSDRGREVAADPATVGQVNLELRPAEEREAEGLGTSEALVVRLREAFDRIPGVRKLTVLARSGGPAGSDIELRVRGDDLDVLGDAVLWIEERLSSYPGVVEIRDDLRLGKLEARLALKESAQPLGLRTRDLAEEMRHALFGFEVQELQGESEEVQVRVLLPEGERDSLEDLGRLRIATAAGGRVPFEEVASLTTARGYATLTRIDGKRAATVRAEVDKTRANVGRITADLEQELRDIGSRFYGVSVEFEGEKKETQESLGSLAIGFPMALFLIYAIVAILFRSYFQPLAVMLAIPFSLAGAVFGHLIMGFPFTVLSMIGVVALSGIVVNDSLILVDFINRRRAQGAALDEAVVLGARDRIRAILLTSITTMAGLAPLMLERSFQAQFLIPMAVSIVFGLLCATLVTPIILPCVYRVLEDVRGVFRWTYTGRFHRA